MLKTEESPKVPQPNGPFKLEGMGEDALIELRNQIDALLPVKALRDMSLEQEMVLQYRQVRALQAATLNDECVDVNKRAQVANSCASALDALVRMQSKYHDSERFKTIETKLIETLNRMPDEHTKTFFEWYEKNLEAV